MKHLDKAGLDALMQGALTADDRRALVAHLDGGCQICDRFLKEGPSIDTLLRLLDAEAAAPVAPAPPVKEAIWSGAGGKPVLSVWLPGIAAVVLVAATTLLLLVPNLLSSTPPSDWDGVKGQAGASPVTLKALSGKLSAQGMRPEGELQPGQTVPKDRTLVFELDVPAPAARALFVVEADQATALFPPPGEPMVMEDPGPVRLRSDLGWVALSLSDMTGPLTLVAVSTPAPLDLQEDIIAPYLRGEPPEGVSLTELTIELEL